MAILIFASLCYAQEPGSFQPAATNVWGAEYPRVDAAGRVKFAYKHHYQKILSLFCRDR